MLLHTEKDLASHTHRRMWRFICWWIYKLESVWGWWSLKLFFKASERDALGSGLGDTLNIIGINVADVMKLGNILIILKSLVSPFYSPFGWDRLMLSNTFIYVWLLCKELHMFLFTKCFCRVEHCSQSQTCLMSMWAKSTQYCSKRWIFT